MFIIREVLVEDKKLTSVLRLLVGQVVSMAAPQPVSTNGAAVGSSTDVLLNMPKQFRFKELADEMEKHGYSRKSAGNVLTRGKADKTVKSLGHGRWSKV